MNQIQQSGLSLLLLSALAGSASAQEGPQITISGFGTAALTMTDTDDAEFARPNQQSGVKKRARTGPDSNFGIQATAKFNDMLSFTAQGLVRKAATDQFGAELPWAFVKIKSSEELSFRLGRIGLPVYMISDFRNVGYANTMIRPPAEVYRQVIADYFEGADVVYQHSFGDTTVTAQVGYGGSNTRQTNNTHVKFRNLSTIHIVAENGPVSLRFGRSAATVTLFDNAAINGLLATLRTLGFNQAAQDFTVTDVKGSFTSVGATLDWHDFLVQTEYAKRKTDTRAIASSTSWYAMFGYRIGKFTPYYYHGNIKQDTDRSYSGVPAVGPLAPLAAGLNGIAKIGLQSNDAVGMRWDFYKSAALKVQVDRIKPKDGPGAFINAKPTFTGPVNVYAAGIDFVF